MGSDKDKIRLNPFPGLRPFLPEESDLFFGREGESDEVLRKLLKNRFVTVMGASGSGKSSLIYCGVLPRVRELSEPDSSGWKIMMFRPGNDPVSNLSETISQAVNNGVNKESINAVLISDRDGLTNVIRENIISANQKVLIVVDQFEELFRYSISGAVANQREDISKFVNLLENAVKQTTVDIYCIITMRSDFIGECAHFQGFTQLINNSNYLVPHMSRENYRAAIEGPVKFAGSTIDQKLVETILNQIGDQTDQLPVLQHALMRTWAYWQELDDPSRPISFTDYDAVGTMSDAMSRHANEAYEELSQRGREICEKTFKTITEKGADNKGVRHPSSVSSIKKIVGCTSEELFEVIEKFRVTSRSFLTPREGVGLADDSVIDVSHESLMRLWDRLKQWVDEEAASVQMYMRLSEASAMYQQGKTTLWRPPDLQLAINWREQQKPTLQWAERYDPAFERVMVYLRTSEKEYQAEEENKIRLQKRQLKRARIVLMIVGTAAIISLGFMMFAFVQKIAADRASSLAEERRKEAEKQKAAADSSAYVATLRKQEADSSAKVAIKRKQEADSSANQANIQRARAVESANIATRERTRAEIAADSANKAKIRAEIERQRAEDERKRAQTLRMLAIGKQMSVKSLQLQGKQDLQTLLAYQAYLFNTRNEGKQNDADIYQGLYNVAKQYGNPNYKVFKGHASEIKSIAFVPGKREFYTSGSDKKVMKGSLDTREQNLQIVYTGNEIIEVLAVSPDTDWLACGGDNAVIKMIPIRSGNAIQYDLKGHTGKIKSLVFSYDGKYLYSASLDGRVLKWDLAARTSVTAGADGIKITSIDISSNGNYLAGVTPDGKAIIWNTAKSSDNFNLNISPGKKVKTLRFKPGANTLAIGYTDGFVEMWDIESRTRISEIQAHSTEVNDIRFNNKLSQMATGSMDKSLKIWDTNDLTYPPISFIDEDSFVMVIEFSPDGQLVVTGQYDASPNNIIGRPTSVTMLAQDICKGLTRNMTPEEWSTYVAPDVKYETTCPEKELSIKANVIR
jgi:WD40 repeat protein